MQLTSTFMYRNAVKQAIYLAALFVLLAFLFLPQSLYSINIFDEGFIVSGAMLVNDGKLPYRDFLSVYGPGQYYVTAAIFSVLGEELRFARYLHVALLASLGLTTYVLAKQSSRGTAGPLLLLLGYIGIVMFAKPSVGYPAITATLFLLLGAFGLIKWADTFRADGLVLASCMIGIAGLFRWDFGIFGLLALAFTLAIVMMQERGNTDRPIPFISWAIAALGPALLILAVIYIPLLVIFSNPVRWYQEVVHFSLTEFSKWRNLEFVRPNVWALLGSSSAINFERAALSLAYLVLPLALAIGGIITVAHVHFRHRAKPIENNIFILTTYLTLICFFLLNQMRVRPTLWQGFPAMAVSLPLIVLLWDYYKDKIKRSKPMTMTLKITGFILGAMLFNLALHGLHVSTDEHLILLETPRSTDIRIKPETQPYIDLVKYVQNNTKPGEAIFSGVQDHSRLVVHDAMLYFLTDRPPADRFLELEPGISNTRLGQEELIKSIQQKNVRVIVLADILSDEPNLTSRSNGVKILDDFIRANYRFDRNFGNQMVFIKK